jgi:hypothetical protein
MEYFIVESEPVIAIQDTGANNNLEKIICNAKHK